MPPSNRYRYVIHARCSLSAYPEARKLRHETGATIGDFIFEDILCRWGTIETIVTDNGPAILAGLEHLSERYGIRHIRISPYNSQAQGPIERRHFDIHEALVKTTSGEPAKWSYVFPAVLWAERVTIQKSTGYSPYWIAHGIEPLFPFDLAEATYMAPVPIDVITTEELLVSRAIQLQKRAEDLDLVKERLIAARWSSVRQFEKAMHKKIIDYDFKPGSLVLVRNSTVEKSLDRKTKPRYFGPMIVVRRTKGGSYILGELDGTLSKLRFAAFRLLPYHPRTQLDIPDSFNIPNLDDLTHDTPHSETNSSYFDEDT